jgi:hypothetical protein
MTLVDGTVPLTHRAPGIPVREILLGEDCEVRSLPGNNVSSIDFVSGPDGANPTLDTLTITLEEDFPGLYKFKINGTGQVADLFLFGCEPSCLDAVPEYQRSGKSGARTAEQRRMVLRSMAQHTTTDAKYWDGTAASLVNRNLEVFGG